MTIYELEDFAEYILAIMSAGGRKRCVWTKCCNGDCFHKTATFLTISGALRPRLQDALH